MADELILDAPEVEDIEAEVEESTPEVEQDQPEPEETTTPEPEGDGRSLPQWIKNLKASDPAAYKEAKGIFFGKKSFEDKLKDFDLDGTKSWLEEVGGKDAIAQQITDLRTSKDELDGINEALRTGNTELIAEMAEAHPDSFPKLAEAAVAQWAKADPEGWERHHAGVIAATIAQSGIPLFLERLNLYLENGKTQEVAQGLQQLQQWTGSFGKTAAQQPTSRQTTQNPQLAEREQRIAQQESKLFVDSARPERDLLRSTVIDGELKSYIARRPGDNDAKELAARNIIWEVEERLRADRDYQRKLNDYQKAGDRDGYLRLIKSRETQAIKDIAPTVGRKVFGSPVTSKPAPKLVANVAKPAAQVPMKRKDKWDDIFASA